MKESTSIKIEGLRGVPISIDPDVSVFIGGIDMGSKNTNFYRVEDPVSGESGWVQTDSPQEFVDTLNDNFGVLVGWDPDDPDDDDGEEEPAGTRHPVHHDWINERIWWQRAERTQNEAQRRRAEKGYP